MGDVTGGVIHDVMGVVTWQLLNGDTDPNQTIIPRSSRPLLVASHEAAGAGSIDPQRDG
jgi:hypothetical protein